MVTDNPLTWHSQSPPFNLTYHIDADPVRAATSHNAGAWGAARKELRP